MALYEDLESQILVTHSFDDLLRSQIVYAVSAFDKLIHDLIRIGMVEIFCGRRSATPKYLTETISLQAYQQLRTASLSSFPPPEYYFEQEVIKKLKIVSYQDPNKVAEGLSYIWQEKQKWQRIAIEMSTSNSPYTDKTAKQTLKLIADRRNSIVHEAHINPLTNQKYSIDKVECQYSIDFLVRCGEAIFSLVQNS